MPLYLFDKRFCKTAPQLASDFSVPEYFTDDLFSVLGEDKRPDYRSVGRVVLVERLCWFRWC